MKNIEANRAARKWTRRENAGRVLWALASPLFRLSPRPIWGWRCQLLRLFGAKIGKGVHIHPTVRIAIPWHLSVDDNSAVGERAILYALGSISIGKNVTISQGAHLCAGSHDWRSAEMTLLKPPITIKDDVWICADAFVGPNVTIGKNTILSARAVAMKTIPAQKIASGNPAILINIK